ncbi:uncharacterized protein T551_03059 [Pneumocystis jirovecii RU7]|uniref:Ubiquitin carboxyl-terminal hydrolase n=1 Tax=Pneumocystis jirovecii (strain RU7) TaxID=1408657 RepID=A0A0W4ZGT0_PNEJ7|nr:uncharacterized protein T551_03059 [Pneumocystis jirovecii RU7]KTW27560.1 hypothetical protein T551_03059 [Pneumocystis jirovecii RU7]
MVIEKEQKIGDTLEALKKKAEIFEKDTNYPIKLWISTAKKLQDQWKKAYKFETEGNLEMAYVNYLKGSSIVVEVIPNHKDYTTFKNQSGPILKKYHELKKETSLSLFKCQEIYQTLKMRDIEKKQILDESNNIAYTKDTFSVPYDETNSDKLTWKESSSTLNRNFFLNKETDSIKSDSFEISGIEHVQNVDTPKTPFKSLDCVSSPNLCFGTVNLSSSFNINKEIKRFTSNQALRSLNEKLVLPDQTNLSSWFSFIEPETLYKSIICKDNKSEILFLDIRPRNEFKKLRIASENVVCIEPIILTLEENISGDQLEDSLIISPLSEQKMFSDRHKFDHVVYYDWDSRNDNLNGNIFQKEKARILYNLNNAIFNFGRFKKPLKHAPVLLSGGLKAWISFIKKNDLFSDFIKGTDIDNKESLGKNLLSFEQKSNQLSIKPNIDYSKLYISSVEHSLYISQPESEKKYIDTPQKMIMSMNEFESLFKNNTNQTNKTKDVPITLNSNLQSEFRMECSSQNSLSQQLKSTPCFETKNNYNTLGSYNDLNTFKSLFQEITPSNSNNFLKKNIPSNNPFCEFTKVKNDNCRFKELILSNMNTINLRTQNIISQNYNTEQFRVCETIGTTGLTNLGNTCYMNAIIQCLSNTIPFARYYRDGSYKKHINFDNPLGYKGELAQTFAQLISYLWDNEHTYVSPLFFKNVIGRLKEQFRNNDQQDSQEFLAFLLDGLHEELNTAAGRLKPRELTVEEKLKIESMPDQIASNIEWQRYTHLNNSIVVSLFQGQLQSRLKCLTCSFQSTTYNPFTYLSLPIPFTQAKTSTLYECLQFFVQKEYLKDKEQWYCSKCKKPRDATKTLTISKIPEILLIHLKRFRTCGHWKDKIDTKVDFLINNLDLTDFLLKSELFTDSSNHEKYLYHLYAVTNHYGNLDGGHYTAVIKNGFTNSWNLFDDRRVVFCNESDVVVINFPLSQQYIENY